MPIDYKQFAKIVTATDGHQVLFHYDTDEDSRPSVIAATYSEGGTRGDLRVSFENSPEGERLAMAYLTGADTGKADMVREACADAFKAIKEGGGE